jgi:hypothetical protein
MVFVTSSRPARRPSGKAARGGCGLRRKKTSRRKWSFDQVQVGRIRRQVQRVSQLLWSKKTAPEEQAGAVQY